MRKLLLGLVILFLAPALASGQTVNAPNRLWAAQPQSPPSGESDWSSLQQLRVGQKIEVVDTNLKKLKGTFLSFSEEAISLRVGKDEVGVQRPNVLRVSLRGKSKRLRNALIGMAIGAGAGVAAIEICAQASSRFSFSPCLGQDFRAVAYAILVPVGGAAGAGIGAAFPPGYQTIYRAEGKRGGTVP
jgi:hypothetical protein